MTPNTDILDQPDEAFDENAPEEVRASLKQMQAKNRTAVKLTEWVKEPSVMDLKKDCKMSSSSIGSSKPK